MVTQKRRAVKRHSKMGVINLILALALGIVIFFIYKQMSVDAKNTDKTDSGNDNGKASSNGYSVMNMDSTDRTEGYLVLVNKDHPYSFPEAQKLVSIYDKKKADYFVRDKNVVIEDSNIDNLNDLLEGFYATTGINNVNVVSGQRTYESQKKLYDDSLAENGATHTAEFIALPGCSEHHTGLAVDLSIYHSNTRKSEEFDGSGQYGWFYENAWNYGFIQRYRESKFAITGVADEPWHFRYIGVPHAFYITKNDLSLEEYIDLLHQYPFDGTHLSIDTGEKKFDVYYCSGTEVHVPEKGDYTVSGNNIDGFIVTVSIN